MATLTQIEALEILDSRGVPTLAVGCVVDNGVRGNAAVPGARMLGPYEPAPLRDGEPKRHGGLGVKQAVRQIETDVRAALIGKRFGDQVAFDRALRAVVGEDRAPLGANVTLGASLAFARAHAVTRGIALYKHVGEMVGHAPERLPMPAPALISRADDAPLDRGTLGLAVVPAGATSVDEALAQSAAVRASTLRLLRERYHPDKVSVTADGALAAPFFDSETLVKEALEAAKASGLDPASGVSLVVMAAAHARADLGWYRLDRDRLTPAEVMQQMAALVERFPVRALIDPLAADDWIQWTALCAKLPPRVWVAGDDLLAASPARVKRAIEEKAATALVFKAGQVATLSEAAEAVKLARKAGLAIFVAARAGETEEHWLTDLAVGWGAELFLAGALARSDRVAKYNRLLAIEKKTRWPIYGGALRVAPTGPAA